MEPRAELARLERDARRFNRELIVLVDSRRENEREEYIVVGNIASQFVILSPDELEALKAEREGLLIARLEP